MGREAPAERVRQAGTRLQAVLIRAIAAVVVLVMVGGLAFLVYNDVLDDEAQLDAGVILGSLIHATKQSVG